MEGVLTIVKLLQDHSRNRMKKWLADRSDSVSVPVPKSSGTVEAESVPSESYNSHQLSSRLSAWVYDIFCAIGHAIPAFCPRWRISRDRQGQGYDHWL